MSIPFFECTKIRAGASYCCFGDPGGHDSDCAITIMEKETGLIGHAMGMPLMKGPPKVVGEMWSTSDSHVATKEEIVGLKKWWEDNQPLIQKLRDEWDKVKIGSL